HWLALVECRPICQKLAHRPKRAQSGLLIEAQSGQMGRRSADRYNVCHLVPNCGASFALIRQFIHSSIDRRYSYERLFLWIIEALRLSFPPCSDVPLSQHPYGVLLKAPYRKCDMTTIS